MSKLVNTFLRKQKYCWAAKNYFDFFTNEYKMASYKRLKKKEGCKHESIIKNLMLAVILIR